MFTSKALRQVAAHAERQPMIRFLGPRTVPGSYHQAPPKPASTTFFLQHKKLTQGAKRIAEVDHSPHPHPASPTGALPKDFAQSHAASASNNGSRHASFSTYRDHAQQFGPLQKTIRPAAEKGIGGTAGADLGAVQPPKGYFFDRTELPSRFFRKVPLDMAEIEAVESGGAALFK